MVEFAVLVDQSLKIKENEKRHMYLDLTRDVRKL